MNIGEKNLNQSLMVACENGNLPWVKELFIAGADVNACIENDVTLTPEDYMTITPLLVALYWGWHNVIHFLLENGADPYLNVMSDKNAFQIVMVDHKIFDAGMLKLGLGELFKSGFSAESLVTPGKPVLLFCVEKVTKENPDKDYLDFLLFLIERGSSLSAKNEKGETVAEIITSHSSNLFGDKLCALAQISVDHAVIGGHMPKDKLSPIRVPKL